MRDLVSTLPDANTLLSLEREELGAKMLFLLRGRQDRNRFHPRNMQDELQGLPSSQGGLEPRYFNRQREVVQAVVEAWAWLEAQGLIVPCEGFDGPNGFSPNEPPG